MAPPMGVPVRDAKLTMLNTMPSLSHVDVSPSAPGKKERVEGGCPPSAALGQIRGKTAQRGREQAQDAGRKYPIEGRPHDEPRWAGHRWPAQKQYAGRQCAGYKQVQRAEGAVGQVVWDYAAAHCQPPGYC